MTAPHVAVIPVLAPRAPRAVALSSGAHQRRFGVDGRLLIPVYLPAFNPPKVEDGLPTVPA